MRGEQPETVEDEYEEEGSPPLARGTDTLNITITRKVGITPACAGNSIKLFPPIQRSKDHPRLRGEQYISIGAAFNSNRITPACAGNREH